MPWNYEPMGTYLQNQPRYDDEEERRKLEEELRRTQFQPNLLEQGLDLLNRPGRMVRGFAQGAFLPPAPGVGQFEQALAGGLLGGLGQEAGTRLESSGAGILERAGVPPGPGFGDFNARGVAGFGLDVVTDPLSLIPLGKVAGGATDIARRGLGRLPAAAPYAIHPGRSATTMADVATDLARPTPMRRAAGFVEEHIPGAERSIGFASPRLAARSEEARQATSYRVGQSLIEGQVNERTAPFAANESLLAIERAGGMIGDTPWNDVIASSKDPLARQVQQFFADLRNEWSLKFRKMENAGVPEETLNNFRIKDSPVAEGNAFVGRWLLKPGTGEVTYVGPRRVGQKLGIQFEQVYPTVEDAIDAGYRTMGPIATMRHTAAQNLQKFNEMDMAIAIAPGAVGRDMAAIAKAGEGISDVRAVLANARGLQGVLARAARGETVPLSTLGKFRAGQDDLVDEIERTMSRTVEPAFKTAERRHGSVPIPGMAPLETHLGDIDRGLAQARARSAELGIPVAAKYELSPPGVAVPFNLGRDAILEIRTPLQHRTFQRMQVDLNGRIKTAQADLKGGRAGLKAATAGENAKVVGLYEPTGVASLRGSFFDEDTARAIGASMRNEENPALRLAADIAAFPRALQTNYDLGGAFIQGAVQLVNHHGEWLASNVLSLRALQDPKIYAQFMASEIAQEAQRLFPTVGWHRGLTESTGMAGGAAGGFFGRALEKVPGPAGAAARGLTERLGTVFDMQGDVMRVYAAQSFKGHVAAHPEDAMKLGDFINHLTGMAPRGLEGVSKNQQNIERAMLFAPGYLASAFALMGDVLQGGIVGKEATKSLANMLVVGLTGYRMMAGATGQDPIMDPADSRFMTVDLGGTRVGIGGVFRALTGSFGRAWEATENVARGNQPPPRVEDVFDWDNPFARFFRARASTPVGWLMDVVNGETYTGQPITGMGSALVEGAKRAAPFTAVGVGEALASSGRPGGGPQGALAQGLAGLAGLRSFPEPFEDTRNRVSRETFKTAPQPFSANYRDLDTIERARVQASPEIKDRPIPPSARFDRQREQKVIYETYESALTKAAGQVAAGQISKEGFRLAERAAQVSRNERLTSLDERYPPVPRQLSEPEKVRKEYHRLLAQADEFGRRDFDAADAYLASTRPVDQEYVKLRQKAGLEHLPPAARELMEGLHSARDTLRAYRALPKEMMGRYGIWEKYKDATPTGRDAIEKTSAYENAHRDWTQRQEDLRRSSRAVDRALVEFYGNVPIYERRR